MFLLEILPTIKEKSKVWISLNKSITCDSWLYYNNLKSGLQIKYVWRQSNFDKIVYITVILS